MERVCVALGRGIQGDLSTWDTTPVSSHSQSNLLQTDCWRGCAAVFGTSGGVCRLQPAVTLRDPLLSGKTLGREPQSVTNLCGLWGERKVSPTLSTGLEPLTHLWSHLVIGEQCRSRILDTYYRVQSPIRAGSFSPTLCRPASQRDQSPAQG